MWETFSNLVKAPNSIYTTQGVFRSIEIINVSIFNKNVATIDFIAKITNRDGSENHLKNIVPHYFLILYQWSLPITQFQKTLQAL
ncbi:hypothetical protein J0E88_10960 (plasmid) [Campylobacter coli]